MGKNLWEQEKRKRTTMEAETAEKGKAPKRGKASKKRKASDWEGLFVKTRRTQTANEARAQARRMAADNCNLLGEAPYHMQKITAVAVGKKLKDLWKECPQSALVTTAGTISVNEKNMNECLSTRGNTFLIRFSKYSPNDRNISEPEHHTKDYFLKGLCGPFNIKTMKDFSKPMDAHIDYLTRALYHTGVHPDKHVITGIFLYFARLRFQPNSFLFFTDMRIGLVEDFPADKPVCLRSGPPANVL